MLQTGHARAPGLALDASSVLAFAWLKRVQRSVPDDVPGLLCNWTGSRKKLTWPFELSLSVIRSTEEFLSQVDTDPNAFPMATKINVY